MDETGSVATAGPEQLVTEGTPAPIAGPSATELDVVAPRPRVVPQLDAQTEAQTPEWPRVGAVARLDGAGTEDPVPAEGAGRPVDVNLEIEDGETTLFEAAISAFHAREYQRAESLFLEEAQRTLDSAPQRAAIAYRQAALAAGEMGNVDASDHWMRLAGREYLRVTEDDRTPLPFIREAAVMAAKCFLSVENMKVASKGLRRAQAIETVLRADDDLMAEGSSGPVESPSPETPLRIERRATVRPGPDRSPLPTPASTPPPADGWDEPPVEGMDGASGHRRWLHRLRHPRPARHVA
jgi:hypothetical protein